MCDDSLASTKVDSSLRPLRPLRNTSTPSPTAMTSCRTTIIVVSRLGIIHTSRAAGGMQPPTAPAPVAVVRLFSPVQNQFTQFFKSFRGVQDKLASPRPHFPNLAPA